MEKISRTFNISGLVISEDVPSKYVSRIDGLFQRVGIEGAIPSEYNTKHFCSDLIHSLLKVNSVERVRISYCISVKPAITNAYGGMHGGAIAAVTEMVSIACARTVVAKDKELFLGELSMSYLSAAPINVEVIVDASTVRSGRNLTVVAVEFRLKESGQLVYTSRATFYNMPVASL